VRAKLCVCIVTLVDFVVVTEEERSRARTEAVSSEEKTSSSGSNVVTAILCLLKELTKENLLTIKQAIDQQIQEE